jgi:GNAT superfamily N-acetyltransferase
MRFEEFKRATGISQRHELFDDAFPENRGAPVASVDHYLWKFDHAPFVPPSYEYAATEDGRMLGYYGAIPYPYRVGDDEMLVGMVCDVMTHSHARGRGIFTELGRFAVSELQAADVQFLTGYPVRPEVMGGHLRVGWQVAFELPMYLKPLKANAILKAKRLSWLTPVGNFGIAMHLAVRRSHGASGYRCATGSPRELLQSTQFQEFVKSWSASMPNHLIKSLEFYDWRLGAPDTHYEALLVYRDNTVVAAAVGREARLHGIPSFALIDLMVLESEESALSTLYREVDREARRRGAEAIVMMMSRHQARKHRLSRYGFLRSPFTFKLIVHSLNEAIPIERISAEENWHLMWIDSDDL